MAPQIFIAIQNSMCRRMFSRVSKGFAFASTSLLYRSSLPDGNSPCASSQTPSDLDPSIAESILKAEKSKTPLHKISKGLLRNPQVIQKKKQNCQQSDRGKNRCRPNALEQQPKRRRPTSHNNGVSGQNRATKRNQNNVTKMLLRAQMAQNDAMPADNSSQNRPATAKSIGISGGISPTKFIQALSLVPLASAVPHGSPQTSTAVELTTPTSDRRVLPSFLHGPSLDLSEKIYDAGAAIELGEKLLSKKRTKRGVSNFKTGCTPIIVKKNDGTAIVKSIYVAKQGWEANGQSNDPLTFDDALRMATGIAKQQCQVQHDESEMYEDEKTEMTINEEIVIKESAPLKMKVTTLQPTTTESPTTLSPTTKKPTTKKPTTEQRTTKKPVNLGIEINNSENPGLITVKGKCLNKNVVPEFCMSVDPYTLPSKELLRSIRIRNVACNDEATVKESKEKDALVQQFDDIMKQQRDTVPRPFDDRYKAYVVPRPHLNNTGVEFDVYKGTNYSGTYSFDFDPNRDDNVNRIFSDLKRVVNGHLTVPTEDLNIFWDVKRVNETKGQHLISSSCPPRSTTTSTLTRSSTTEANFVSCPLLLSGMLVLYHA